MHIKRKFMPKNWPLPRKGTKYVVAAKEKNSIPLLIVLRDILKLGKTKNEIKKILQQGYIEINGKARKDEKFPLLPFDIITIKQFNKNYKVIIAGGKFKLQEISEKEASTRTHKVIGKKMLGKNKMQVNLDGGLNILPKEKIEKVNVGDSIVFDLKNKKLIKILPMEENAKEYVSVGKHIGEKGIIKEIKGKIAVIKLEKREIEIPIKNLIVIE